MCRFRVTRRTPAKWKIFERDGTKVCPMESLVRIISSFVLRVRIPLWMKNSDGESLILISWQDALAVIPVYFFVSSIGTMGLR